MIKVKRLTETAKLPVKGSKHAAGWDLHSDEDAVIPPGDRRWIRTGVQIELRDGDCGLVWPRSGLAGRDKVDTSAGVLDSDFRGEFKVLLVNNGNLPFKAVIGERIAQLIVLRVSDAEMIEVLKLSETDRGENGFGSTGMGDPNHRD